MEHQAPESSKELERERDSVEPQADGDSSSINESESSAGQTSSDIDEIGGSTGEGGPVESIPAGAETAGARRPGYADAAGPDDPRVARSVIQRQTREEA